MHFMLKILIVFIEVGNMFLLHLSIFFKYNSGIENWILDLFSKGLFSVIFK